MHYYRMRRTGTYDDPAPAAYAPMLTSNGYVLIHSPGHPLARRIDHQGYVLQHRVVLYETLGAGCHPCHWCGMQVDWSGTYPEQPDALVVDHLDGIKTNNAISNLVPSCNPCNSARATNTGTHCQSGKHLWTAENVGHANRGRSCLACRRERRRAQKATEGQGERNLPNTR